MKKITAAMNCIAEILFMIGGTAACAVKDGSAAPRQETVQPNETRQETVQPNETQQETVQPNETRQETVQLNETQQQTAVQPIEAQQTTAQPNTKQQSTKQPEQNAGGQISLEDAKNAALTDAGVSAADVVYTKEKLDYEDGIMVYDIEFYADTVEYEYEINAATGDVYSKSMEVNHAQTGHGHKAQAGTSETYIDIDSATSTALNHAGFSAADVSRLKCEFDIDDGLAVYEVEFDKDGRKYEYTINAADGAIIEYDID